MLMFPEGTRTRDGRIGRFRPGFTTIAKRGRAAVLPVAIEGAYQAWPRRRRFPGPGTIHVHYGPALLPEAVAELSEAELIAEAERRVRDCHDLLCRRPSLSGRIGHRRMSSS